jgi:hypothetical protein
MRYTLKDYQVDAVRGVLENLADARMLHKRGRTSQFSLSATTGAGKTVMAAAVIEALFSGSDEFDFPPDPGAVVLWLSDDPALNQQSLNRIWSAAPALGSRLRFVDTSLSLPELERHNVYFLNTQKLSKKSKLVRGVNFDDEQTPLMERPDNLQSTFYDVLSNTIKNDNLTLYLILDEAHRGMQKQRDRATIVQRLINGQGSVPAIPVVFGISATVDRFDEAMKGATGRTALPSVEVDSALVQASGLLKDDIVLSIPAETGAFQTVLLRRAVKKILASSREWESYAKEQESLDVVKPLLVVQVRDKASDEDLKLILDTLFDAWPGLCTDNVANVFGEHQDLDIAGYMIRYEEPQRIQDLTSIRVLISKTAISTGWDCPRAEVLVSFRSAKDKTHITQLLGRMIRTPLARRIAGNEILNSVDCLLPFFDKDTAIMVARMLMEGATSKDDESGTGGGAGRRVLFDPVSLYPNSDMPAQLWYAMENLPSVTIPNLRSKPIKRFTALAAALAKDGIRPSALENCNLQLCRLVESAEVRFRNQVEAAYLDVTTLDGEELRARLGGGEFVPTAFSETADYNAIREAYNAARRILSPQLASWYVNYLVPDDDFLEEDYIEAETRVAALSLVPELVRLVEREANEMAVQWLTETRVDRKSLSEDKQAEYDRIEAMSVKPERVDVVAPKTAQAETKVREADGTELTLPTSDSHIMVSDNGVYPVNLNRWERQVLQTESSRASFVGWYRNPERAVKESLAIAYLDGSEKWKALRPDFLFFARGAGGKIVTDIVDPHGHHLADALPKLRGLADFTEQYGREFRRIESIAETDGKLRVLDLTKDRVREAIRNARDAKALYESDLAYDYI